MIIARAETSAGEVALRRRDGVDELIVNGVFAMDSAEVSSEQALADAAGRSPGRVLVGGLGEVALQVELLSVPVERQGRSFDYALYRAELKASGAPGRRP